MYSLYLDFFLYILQENLPLLCNKSDGNKYKITSEKICHNRAKSTCYESSCASEENPANITTISPGLMYPPVKVGILTDMVKTHIRAINKDIKTVFLMLPDLLFSDFPESFCEHAICAGI
jgi:hypothetical protein